MKIFFLSLALLLPVGLYAQAPVTAIHADTNLAAMAADADPSFSVATIKPNPSESRYTGFSLVNIQGERYSARNVSLEDLVKFAYSLQGSQIAGLPEWAGQKRWDISAVMEPEGRPDGDQLRTMLRKLLAERFKLAAKTEQRVLPVYTLTVAKGGIKAPASDGKVSGDVEHPAVGGMEFAYRGATIKTYANYLQQSLMNRPVVDQTGLSGRYDFDLTFMPDDTMFGGRFRLPPDMMDKAAPNIFTALQQQLGLKLTPEKVLVDVLVVGHAEEPTEN